MDDAKKHRKSNENLKVVMREKEEGWIKPMKYAPIAHFCKKCNKKNEKDKNFNLKGGVVSNCFDNCLVLLMCLS